MFEKLRKSGLKWEYETKGKRGQKYNSNQKWTSWNAVKRFIYSD